MSTDDIKDSDTSAKTEALLAEIADLEAQVEAKKNEVEILKGGQKVDPWSVDGGDKGIDYDKLVEQFGSQKINQDLLDRMERVTGKKPHHWLRRGHFFSHRDLHKALDAYEQGKMFYLYTGRGPSSESMHMGHLIPFMFTKWLQDTFDVPLVIQITDDEKFYWRDIKQDVVQQMAHQNIKDIIALGFDPKKTFIFRNFQYYGDMYKVISKISKAVTANQVRGCFGFSMSDCVGKWGFPPVQAAPSFSEAFPHIFPDPKRNVFCLIPCAIDQDPYFRMTRDVAPRLKYLKPALIHSIFFPALQGPKTKMSASVDSSAIFLTDGLPRAKKGETPTPSESSVTKACGKKIKANAFSGGGGDLKEHYFLGGESSVDVSYQWLNFFLEDDEELARIKEDFECGFMTCSQIKERLVQVISPIVHTHQVARAKVTDADVDLFCSKRPLSWEGGRTPAASATKPTN